MAQQSFSLLQDKPLWSQVLLGCWCPTMDLVALATADGQLSVHRLDWQKLWLTCPDVRITALCWSSDGKVLATGHRDGSVSLFDVERSELISRSPAHQGAAIASISWVEEAPGPQQAAYSHRFNHRHARLFAKPLTEADAKKAGSSAAGGGGGLKDAFAPAAGRSSWAEPVAQLNLLVSLDMAGELKLHTFGEVPTASIRLHGLSPAAAVPASPSAASPGAAAGGSPGSVAAAAATAGSRPLRPLHCLLLRSLRHLAALCRHDRPEQQQGACLRLSLYDAGMLGQQRHSLHYLASASSQIRAQLQAARGALLAAQREWRQAMGELGKKLQQLTWVMEDHNVEAPDPEGEFLAMLAAGYISPAMQSYLSSTLNESGLRRLARSVDAAVQKCHAQLLDRAQPALEVVAFMLGELKGHAAAVRHGQGLCLPPEVAGRAEMEAAKALLQSEKLRLCLTAVGRQYRCFFAWLLAVTQQLDASSASQGGSGSPAADAHAPPGPSPCISELHDILDFLSGQFRQDRIIADLQDADPPPGVTPESLSASGCGLEAQQLSRAAMVAMYGTEDAWPSRPLFRQLDHLDKLCSAAFDAHIQAAISPTLRPVLQVALTQPAAGACCAMHTAQAKCEGDDGTLYVACSASGAAGGAASAVLLTAVQPAAGGASGVQPELKLSAILLELPGQSTAQAVAFYKDQLALLLANLVDNSSTLMLLPTAGLGLADLSSMYASGLPQAGLSLEEACRQVGAVRSVPQEGVHSRAPPSGALVPPLLLSGPRGVAALFTTTQRALVLDLEDHEDEGDDDGGGETVGDIDNRMS